MRAFLYLIMIVPLVVAGGAWAGDITEEILFRRQFSQAYARLERAHQLLKSNAEHNRKVEATIAGIKSVQLKGTFNRDNDPEGMNGEAIRRLKSEINGNKNKDEEIPSLRHMTLYNSPNDHVRLKPFSKSGATGLFLQMRW